MVHTTQHLENALEAEGAKLLKLIASLENDELFKFAELISVADVGHPRPADAGSAQEVIHVARNIRRIIDALENFYGT